MRLSACKKPRKAIFSDVVNKFAKRLKLVFRFHRRIEEAIVAGPELKANPEHNNLGLLEPYRAVAAGCRGWRGFF